MEDLRLLALADANQLRFELKSVKLNELAETAMGLFSAQAAEKNISLNLNADPDLPEVMVDPQRFQQVIGNLIDNALRFAPEVSSIDVTIHHQDGSIALSVKDKGPGIREDELPHIFDRFWRGEKSRARSTGGAGLGLSIARQLVEAQGGKIMGRNCTPQGFEVRITLPVVDGTKNSQGRQG